MIYLRSIPFQGARLVTIFTKRLGDYLPGHQKAVWRLQCGIIIVYAALLFIPIFIPLPDYTDHIWTHLTIFARFVFWGVWWPGVLLSILFFGRLWCGVLCPEGALSEWASKHGRGRAIPRWIRWPGWLFTAFSVTTIYGQMVSV